MSWYLDAAATPTGRPAIDAETLSYSGSVAVGFGMGRITGDDPLGLQRYRGELLDEIEAAVGQEGQRAMAGRRVAQPRAQFEFRRALALRNVAAARMLDPALVNLPTTLKEFEAEARRREQADFADLAALSRAAPENRFAAETLGALGSAMTAPESLPLLFFGPASGARIATVVAVEGALGAVAEAGTLDRQTETAERLGIDPPDPLTQIAMGAVGGAVLGGGLTAAGRYIGGRLTRDTATGEALGPGDPAAQEAALLRAEAALAEGRAPFALVPPQEWAPIRNGIFAGESGGDYDALFGFSNRDGGPFANVRLTEMTVDQALDFADPQGAYAAWVRGRIGRTATPMGAYQVVGTTLRAAKAGLGLRGDEVMTPELQDLIGQYIFRTQGTGAWVGYRGPRAEVPVFDTSRPFTGAGQVVTGSGTRIDVTYEVVDASILRQAAGDLQPRDRGRINSDAWVADTAARLDPALLAPAPTADRGTPIVGPDGTIESGNGRVRAIQMAYDRFPDRAGAYRGMIEQITGQPIPEGVQRPVLIARRQTALEDGDLRRFVIEAQDSGVADLTPTEVAQTTARALTAERLAVFDPARALDDEANGEFLRRIMAEVPASARNAMVDPTGRLNAAGQRRLRTAFFARAWADPALIARHAELEDAGELKSLLRALEEAAPHYAALRADIEAGLVDPAMDIGAEVIGAMRLIAAARDLAASGQGSVARMIEELLAEVDLVDGAVSPLVVALVRKFYPAGRPGGADSIARFLAAYATEARQAGRVGGLLGDVPSVVAVLRRVDGAAFADLPADLPRTARAPAPPPPPPADPVPGAWTGGAASPEAEAADVTLRAQVEPAASLPPDPDRPQFPDTRGQGLRFHGAVAPIDSLRDEFYEGGEGNLYGGGFYTSDAVAISAGYRRGRGAGVVYRVDEIVPVNAFDMEQPVPEWLISDLQRGTENSTFGDLLETALAENPANVRELYDEMRLASGEFEIPRYEMQEIFNDTMSAAFLARGFDALDHAGGLRTQRSQHSVRIYLRPAAQVRLTHVDPVDPTVPIDTTAPAETVTLPAAPPPRAATPAATVAPPPAAAPEPISPGAAPEPVTTRPAPDADTIAARAAAAGLRAADWGDLQLPRPDGSLARVADILDEAEADLDLADLILSCNPKGGRA